MAGLLKKSELARIIGVSPATINNWSGRGLPKAKQTENGKADLYRLEDVKAWMSENNLGPKEKVAEPARPAKAKAVSNSGDDLSGMTLDDIKKEKMWLEKKDLLFKYRVNKGKYLRRSAVDKMMFETLAFFREELEHFHQKIYTDEDTRIKIRQTMELTLEKLSSDLEKISKKIAARQREKFVNKVDKGQIEDSANEIH